MQKIHYYKYQSNGKYLNIFNFFCASEHYPLYLFSCLKYKILKKYNSGFKKIYDTKIKQKQQAGLKLRHNKVINCSSK